MGIKHFIRHFEDSGFEAGVKRFVFGCVVAAVFIGVTFIPVACSLHKTGTQTLPTGAYNNFDAQSYDTLLTAQAALTSLKTSSLVGQPDFKTALNQVIGIYNAAQATWQAYHTQLMAGQSPDPSAAAKQISALTAGVASLQIRATPSGDLTTPKK